MAWCLIGFLGYLNSLLNKSLRLPHEINIILTTSVKDKYPWLWQNSWIKISKRWKSSIIQENLIFLLTSPLCLAFVKEIGQTTGRQSDKIHLNTNKHWKPIFHYTNNKHREFSFFGHLLDFKHRDRANSSQQVIEKWLYEESLLF